MYFGRYGDGMGMGVRIFQSIRQPGGVRLLSWWREGRSDLKDFDDLEFCLCGCG